MCIRYIDEMNGIVKEIDFKPEVYIYIKKLMEEKNKTFDEIVNDIISEHALNKFNTKTMYIPYVQPATSPSTTPSTPWYKYGTTTTSGDVVNYKTTCGSYI